MRQLKKMGYAFYVSTCLSFGACTAADEVPEQQIKTAMDGLCDKFQQCAMQSMQLEAGDEGMPAAFMNMFIEQSKAQCAMLMKQEDVDLEDKTMVEKSLACVNEMADSSCDDLMMGKQPESCEDMKEYQNQL